MPRKFELNQFQLTEEKSLKTLVENRKVFTLNFCELNVFETYESSEMVPLAFGDFVVTSMLRGKKVMHLQNKPGFEYLPGETVLIPANVTMNIDFPEANKSNPTQCIALALDNQKIQQIVSRLNEEYPKAGHEQYWQLHHNEYHFKNNYELAKTMNKIIEICAGSDSEKDILADLTLKELVVRLIQSQHLQNVQAQSFIRSTAGPLEFVVNYIKGNIGNHFSINELSAKACMSAPTFYRAFKHQFGLSPLDFILREKIKYGKMLLAENCFSITEICYELGFSSLNYFDRQFKRVEGITPKQFRQVLRGAKA